MTAPIDTIPEAVARMLEGVTPGPWAINWYGPEETQGDVWHENSEIIVCETVDARNAHFLAWAREAIPALAARVAEVEADNVRLQAARDVDRVLAAFDAEAAEAKVARLTEALRDIADSCNYTRAEWMQDTARDALEEAKG
jgi:hypothetical protein